MANALLRRFGRDHPKACGKQERDPPEVVAEAFEEWLDELVLRKAIVPGPFRDTDQ